MPTMRKIECLELSVPEKYASAELQPHLFRDWFRGNMARKYIQYYRRPLEALSELNAKSGDRILDVGCGWGYATMLANSKGAHAFGVDIEHEALVFGQALAQENDLLVSLKYGDAISLDFPDEYFDHIISIETLEHITPEERMQALREMKRCLRRRGRIVISTPNPLGIAELGKKILAEFHFIRKHVEPGTDWGEKHKMLSVNEVVEITRALNLPLQSVRHIIFVVKILPDRFFPLVLVIERLLETMPFFCQFGATSIYVISKAK